ncbi:HD domain-containing protein [Thermogutta terrifontis]|nr:HD domain-containing protein [Thermogutta terrifontis]
MARWEEIPELMALDSRRQLIRIPPELDVPITDRVRRLIDTAAFRRLARITQLGLVSLVYPAANHTRFEHSLGVYRLALLVLKHLSHDPRFRAQVTPHEGEKLIVAALLHDLGHWPFCHAIEDLGLPDVPPHEAFVARFLRDEPVALLLERDWGLQPDDVLNLVAKHRADGVSSLLQNILSGPLDVDKMDYLFRDSLHAGVPYGRFFDQQRLVGSLCLNERGDGLAITEKGKTAAELMVFARYVMFSEVYWHHAVRSATAMLQRSFFELKDRLDLEALFSAGEWEFIESLRQSAGQSKTAEILNGLFGPVRTLYKRIAQFHYFDGDDVYRRIAGRPYRWLVACAHHLAELLSRKLGIPVSSHQVLVDAPPVHKEIEFRVDVFFPKEATYRPLSEVSPVVRALAQEQFDHYVKRVRVFAAPSIAGEIKSLGSLTELMHQAAEATDASQDYLSNTA